MGNNQSDTLDAFNQQYEEVKKLSHGAIVSHKETKQTYFLKEISYALDREYIKQLQRLDDELKKAENENIIKIVKYWKKQFNNFCSNSYKIFIIYQCPQINLTDEIIARQKQGRYFEQCDLWSIMQSCVNAMIDLKPTLSIDPSKVYILPDGLLKLIHNDMIDEQYRCIIMEGTNYAPEKLINFNKPDKSVNLQKQSIFSMGMTLLSAAILTDIQQCYDYKNGIFKTEKLRTYLEELGNRYSEKFFEVISIILEQSPNRRPSLMQLQNILNQHEEQEQSNKSYQNIEDIQKSQHIAQQQIQSKPLSNITSAKKIQLNPQIENSNVDTYITKKPSTDFSYQYSLQHSSSNSTVIPQSFSANIQSYQPSHYNSTHKENQNLFTDPKLLQMIRTDLQKITQLQSSRRIQSTSSFGNDKTNSIQVNRNFSSQEDFYGHQPHQALFKKSKKNNHQYEEAVFKKIIFQDQSVYEGFIIKNMKHGKGKITYPDGAYYEGEFKNDKMHGMGSLYYTKGKPAYEGQWMEDKFHGKGILYNQNPLQLTQSFHFEDFNNVEDYWVKYEGNFVEDSKCGEGTLVLSNAQVFEGQFKNDCINGKGVFRDMNGNLYYGHWEQNKLVSLDQQTLN